VSFLEKKNGLMEHITINSPNIRKLIITLVTKNFFLTRTFGVLGKLMEGLESQDLSTEKKTFIA